MVQTTQSEEAKNKIELESAEKELLSEIEQHTYAELDTFLSRLIIWQQAETQCSLIREQFQLAFELKSQEKDQWVKLFAEWREKRDTIEHKLTETLENMNDTDIDTALTKQFAVPGVGIISCPKHLADKLRALRIKNKEKE